MITSSNEFVSQRMQITENNTLLLENESINPSSTVNDIICPIEKVDSSFMEFFHLNSDNGTILGKKDGSVIWRKDNEEIKMLILPDEQIKKIDFICKPELSDKLNTLFVFGDQGTIMVYTKASSDNLVELKQFDLLTTSVYQIEKIKDFVYMLCLPFSKLVLLEFDKDINLKSTQLQGTSGAHQIFCYTNKALFEALLVTSSTITMVQYKYNSSVSIVNNPEAIQLAIEDALDELAISESVIQSVTQKDESLNKQLISINRTLYALRSINNQRELGIGNSLETTGFELTVRPVMKTNAYESCQFNTTCHLRVCIKTSNFLELEHWDLYVYLMHNGIGQQHLISLVGFEPHYEMGIERYLIWERDIQIDLSSLILPLEISTELVMSPAFHFPVSRMILDDFHFAIPVTQDINLSIKKRGLEEISNRLLQSLNKQSMHDRRSKLYTVFALGFNKQDTSLFNFKDTKIYVRYLIEEDLSDEKYRSIMASIFNEGRTLEDLQHLLQNGAEEAIFSLAAYPGCPIILQLSRLKTNMIEFSIQSIYPPALFKTEATLLQRISRCFIEKPIDIKRNELEELLFEIQEKYQQTTDNLWDDLNQVIQRYYAIHQNDPIGSLLIYD
ncbi:uncharacterized protein BX663DRAFT_524689 [Cokeromyces recurvatus]|uniref:uncharacterized protein n=1 Tax=Cokeromyces recurvatus TaxID=90255 RepID=UPI0022206605|nr:uncharacterized protein BX663DRAFT_524689 [Cokeromyces recurvatus]KAI7898587.1 hypothetical protein BX663DRAFT_524689 [Cokeromyces recurvatus]